MKKILLINPFGIGDVLFTTAVARCIKEAMPEASIGYWCNERVEEVLRYNPRIDRVFAVSRGDIKRRWKESSKKGMTTLFGLISGLRSAHFDISLDFSLEHRYSLISNLIGIRERIGFDYKGRGCFLTRKVAFTGYRDKHVIEHYLDLLGFLGIKGVEPRTELFLPDEARQQAAALVALARKPLIGIAAGGGLSWGRDAHFKHWPAEKFAMLASWLIEENQASVVLLGDAAEKEIAGVILENLRHRCIDLTGATTLAQLCAVIARLDVLIANDGGPLHIAVAQGVPTVSFFGPVDEKVYGPYPASERHRVIAHSVACRPCYRDFRFPGCAYENRCLRGITVEEAYAEVLRLL